MKAWLAKDKDGINPINIFAFKPNLIAHVFGGYHFEGGKFPKVWENVPWQLLDEMGIDYSTLGREPLEVDIRILPYKKEEPKEISENICQPSEDNPNINI